MLALRVTLFSVCVFGHYQETGLFRVWLLRLRELRMVWKVIVDFFSEAFYPVDGWVTKLHGKFDKKGPMIVWQDFKGLDERRVIVGVVLLVFTAYRHQIFKWCTKGQSKKGWSSLIIKSCSVKFYDHIHAHFLLDNWLWRSCWWWTFCEFPTLQHPPYLEPYFDYTERLKLLFLEIAI